MKQSDSDIVCDFFTWHAGGGSYVLTDEYNNVSLENLLFSLSKDYAMIPKSDSSKFLVSYSTFFVFEDFMISIWVVYQMICVYLMVFFKFNFQEKASLKMTITN